MKPVQQYICEGARFLEDHNVPEPEISAKYLLAFALKKSFLEIGLTRNQKVNRKAVQKYQLLLNKRARRYPLQYLLKTIPFRDINLHINENCLIPRPETELLVEKAIKLLKGKNPSPKPSPCGRGQGEGGVYSVLDIGTGSGAIAISLANELEDISIVATDSSPHAIKLAKKNAKINHVAEKIKFRKTDVAKSIKDQFDLIISNPPYVKTRDYVQAQAELHYEPRIALDGGKDGLVFYRRIIKECSKLLRKSGTILFEVGFDQAKAVSDLLKLHRFHSITIYQDYAGLDRIVGGVLS